MGDKRSVYRLLVEKPEGKKPLGGWIRFKMDLADRCGWD
jgi:hypothetical protein